jgi:hypothetical protein
VVDECIVDVGIVAAVEFDEIGWDVVPLNEGAKGFFDYAVDDTEGEPVVHTKDAVYCILCRNRPHTVILNCIF